MMWKWLLRRTEDTVLRYTLVTTLLNTPNAGSQQAIKGNESKSPRPTYTEEMAGD